MATLEDLQAELARRAQLNAPAATPAAPSRTGVTAADIQAELARRAQIAKNPPPAPEPQWGDTTKNILPSAERYVGNMVDAVKQPLTTAGNLADLVAGSFRAAAQDVLPTSVFNAIDSVGDQSATQRIAQKTNAFDTAMNNRYGTTQQWAQGDFSNAKRTAITDPVGAAGDLATVLGLGGKAVSNLPGLGKTGQVISSVGNAVDPMNVVTKPVGFVAKNVVEPVLTNSVGLSTGAGTDAIRQAAKAGYNGNDAFQQNMRGNVPIADVVDQARQGLRDIAKDRATAYQSGMAGVKADPTALDFAPINQAVSDAANMAYHKGVPLSAEAASTVNKIAEQVKLWQSKGLNTADDLDALKQAIGEIRASTDQGTKSRRIADTVYNSIASQITQQAPSYAKTMQGYGEASNQLDELSRTFSLGENAAKDTTIRKLQSVMRNNVNSNYGRRAELMDVLAQKKPDLPYAIAGQALNSATPRGLVGPGAALGEIGLAGMVNPYFLAALPFSSPRMVGEGAYYAGKAAKGINKVTPDQEFLRLLQQSGRVNGLLGQ
jgi:hypothetical protein